MEKNSEILIQNLIDRLNTTDLNYGQILSLASQLALLDPDNVRFFTDASLINRLGRELVVKQETAVSELVKNAFDADATRVVLTFVDASKPGGKLIIQDNGHGMNRDQIRNGFMRLSTTDKTHNPVSPKYKRKRTGRKGIGRFAAQRLGNKLSIISQVEDNEFSVKIDVDWELFVGDQEIFQIANKINDIEKQENNGTTLIVNNLEEAWADSQIQRVYRYLIDLIQPFPLSKTKKTSQGDPGFEVVIERIESGEKETVASVEKLVYEYSLAEIDGLVDKKGQAKWVINSQQLDIDEEAPIGKDTNEPNTRFEYLKNVYLKSYYYIYLSEYIPRGVRSALRALSYERGGIRLYRNGFRVLPYGDAGDDWLGLDIASSRRSILPPANNLNFFGFIEIIDDEGNLFEETASREGLIENDAVKELKDFAYRVLVGAVLRIAEARDRKQRPVKRDVPEIRPSERIKDAAEELREAASELLEDIDLDKKTDGETPTAKDSFTDYSDQAYQLRTTANLLEQLAIEQEEETARLLEEIGMLRILASLGLTIGEFSHEVKHLIPSTLADANQIKDLHPDSQTERIVNRLTGNLGHFGTYTSVFDRAASDNVRREVAPQELGVLLRTFWEVIKPSCDRYGINLPEPDIRGYDLFTTPMHPSEWISILFNLFTNAQKAIRRKGATPGKIKMSAGHDRQHVLIEFCDNGDGVAPEIEERIFDAFFSTSTPASPFTTDEDGLTGTGLGLKIIKDIVTSYNGEISLVGAPRGYNTCFRIELPGATDKDL